jgi:site-specific DNA-methyltransferase (adenine-specific)
MANETSVKTTGKPSALVDTRVIYCGDNLEQLKKLPNACVDLIYIDPPFNSNRNYEVFWGETKEKRAFEDRHASTQAYIEFMRPRCVEMARVLKKTGSFYYHCDWHASHYVKVMLDQIFGENCFQNEIVWRRTNSRTEKDRWPRIHDTIYLYTGDRKGYTFKPLMLPGDEEKIPHTLITASVGLKYNTFDLTGPGATDEGESGQPWRGFNPKDFGRHWGYSHSQMDEWDAAGLIHWPKKAGAAGGFPRKRDENSFIPKARMVQACSVWTDIDRLNQTAKERLGYPTQKPLALLERIIRASSKPNDIVLDAFCGCGTALVAAQNLGRQWIGIDISPTACRVMAKRMRDVCKLREDDNYWQRGKGFVVRDLPWTEKQLREIPPFEFENWAVIALGGIPNKTQVGDMGIDGRIYPLSALPHKSGKAAGELDFMDDWYPIQVKQKDKVGRPDIDMFEAAMIRAKRKKGFFVGFDFSHDALAEIGAFFKAQHTVIVPLTVREILDEQIAQKLA